MQIVCEYKVLKLRLQEVANNISDLKMLLCVVKFTRIGWNEIREYSNINQFIYLRHTCYDRVKFYVTNLTFNCQIINALSPLLLNCCDIHTMVPL